MQTHILILSLIVYNKWGSEGGVTSGVFCLVLSALQVTPNIYPSISAWLLPVTAASCTQKDIQGSTLMFVFFPTCPTGQKSTSQN